ncbi:MAG: hypothetical protein K8H84_02685 [Sulfuricella denitrificans]|nr:hypothetical protein [Sulfuricella denitrificans]
MFDIQSASRYRAAGVHLSISALIGAVTLAVMLFLWYPPPLFFGMGGNELALLIVGVDIAIGPLATLVVFNPGKKTLKHLLFDLSVIAALQLGALSYGIYAMHQGRPVFTVFTGERLAVISPTEIEADDLAKGSAEEYRTLSLTGPRLVATEAPADPEEQSRIAFAAFGGGGIQNFPKYYVPYAGKTVEVLAASRPLSDLNPAPADLAVLQRYLATAGRAPEQLRCLPVSTKRETMTAIIDARNGELLKLLDIRPTLREGVAAGQS